MPLQYNARVRKAVPRSELRASNTRLMLDVVSDTYAKLEYFQVPSSFRRRMAGLEDHYPGLARLLRPLKPAARGARRAFKKISP